MKKSKGISIPQEGAFIPQQPIYSLADYGGFREIFPFRKGHLYKYRNLKEVDNYCGIINYEFDLYDNNGTRGTYFVNGYDFDKQIVVSKSEQRREFFISNPSLGEDIFNEYWNDLIYNELPELFPYTMINIIEGNLDTVKGEKIALSY